MTPLAGDVPETGRLFPLPLTAFEELMLLDDRPHYPATFSIVLQFEGRASSAALEVAFARALARHPLLTAQVSRQGGLSQWRLPDQDGPRVQWPAEYDPMNPPEGRGIDLTREPGLRIWARSSGPTTDVSLQVHHACCDGLGARRFIIDLLLEYGRETAVGSELPNLDPIDPARLRDRGAIGQTATAGQQLRFWERVRNAGRFLRGATPLAPPDRRGSAWRQDPSRPRLLVTDSLGVDETDRLLQRIRLDDATLNDWSVAVLFRTLAEWNSERGRLRPGQQLRILIPTDLRERADRYAPAMNRLAFCFLVRRGAECADWPALVRGICDELAYIKRNRLGLDFARGLELAHRFPKLFPLLVKRPGCTASAILTNMGDCARGFHHRVPLRDGCPVVGDLVLRRVYGAPPIRRGTRAAFSLSTLGHQLHCSLQCDPYLFDVSSARALLDRYLAGLRSFA